MTTPLANDPTYRRALAAYEASRRRLGGAAAVLVALVPLASYGVGGRAMTAAALGVSLVVLMGAAVWRGGPFALAATSGLKAGLVPLIVSHAANLYGHVCIPGQGCTSLCVPACTAGGVVAGAFVEYVARNSKNPMLVRVGGAGLAFCTGSLGCSCVGYAGMLGLTLGLGCTVLLGRVLAPPRASFS